MVASLRSQGSEERERLKYEHRRLEMAQSSLDAERKAHQLRVQEETDEHKKKVAAFNSQTRAKELELQQRMKELEDASCKLEVDKESFRSHVLQSVKSSEDGLKKLKAEEARIIALKDELRRESLRLQDERAAVIENSRPDSPFCSHYFLQAVNDLMRADDFYAKIEEEKRQVLTSCEPHIYETDLSGN